MKEKKGFTIVELLAVIVVLALIIGLAAPNITSSSKAVKEKAYETKVNMIEDAAILYGQDNMQLIINDGYEMQIQVKDLISENYLEKDNKTEENMINDPRNSKKYMDDLYISIKVDKNTRKVTANIIEE